MKKYAQGGIFREGMEVPQDIDGGSAPPRHKNTTGSKRKPTKSKAMGGRVYSDGGYVRAADGCAMRGKTKGTMVKMAKGGKTC